MICSRNFGRQAFRSAQRRQRDRPSRMACQVDSARRPYSDRRERRIAGIASAEAHARIGHRARRTSVRNGPRLCYHPRAMADDVSQHPRRRISRTRRTSSSRARCGRATLDEYIGQREVKANLSVLLPGAPRAGERRPTTSCCTARPASARRPSRRSSRASSASTSATRRGPAIERAGDLAAILTSLDERDVLFIDEVHRLNRAVEEILYPAMEDYALDVMIGKGPSRAEPAAQPEAVHGRRRHDPRGPHQLPVARPVRRHVPARLLHRRRAGRDRRPLGARSWTCRSSPPATRAIARRGRGTPRIVNRLLKRVRDHAQVHGDGRVRRGRPRATRCARMEIDDEGLDSTDRKLPGRDRPEVRVGAGRRGRAGGGAVRGDRDHRGRATSRSCCGSGSSTARRRAASPRTSAGRTCPALGYEIPPPRRAEAGMPGLWDEPLDAGRTDEA